MADELAVQDEYRAQTWAMLIRECKASGMTNKDFCEQRGISEKSEMTQKYVDGVPLARQEKIWARQGVELSRATLANWVIQCAQTWLKPLYKEMKQQLLEQDVIHADETVVQVLKENGSCQKEMAGGHAGWGYDENQQSGCWLPVLHEAVLSGKEK